MSEQKGRCFGYLQTNPDESPGVADAQRHAALAEHNAVHYHSHRWADCYADLGVDPSVPLDRRPAGSQLVRQLARGDMLILPDFHRAFPCLRDLVDLAARLRAKGARLVLLEPPLDSADLAGAQALAVLEAFTHFERNTVLAGRRRNSGMRKGPTLAKGPSNPPVGTRFLGEGADRFLTPDRAQRIVMGRMVGHAEDGWTPGQIAFQLNSEGVLNAGRKWTWMAVTRRVKVEEALRRWEAANGPLVEGRPMPHSALTLLRRLQ